MKTINKIKCWLNFHDDELESVDIPEYANCFFPGSETSNNRWVCKRCGRKTEWTGSTTFSLKFKIIYNKNS